LQKNTKEKWKALPPPFIIKDLQSKKYILVSFVINFIGTDNKTEKLKMCLMMSSKFQEEIRNGKRKEKCGEWRRISRFLFKRK